MEIAVQTPCQQRWSEMVPNQKGRFCVSCQNTVVDFTTMTDRQLMDYFQYPNQSVCGRFRNDQLNRNLIGATSLSVGSARQRWVSLLAAGLLSWSTAQGQVMDGNVLQTEQIVYELTHGRSPAKPSQTTVSSDSTYVISGRIIDQKGHPIAGAFAYVKEANRGTNGTDKEGNFRINLTDYQAEKYVLVIGSIGYIRQEITRKTTDLLPITVTLAEDTAALGQVITVGYSTVQKPTLPQKVKKRFR